MIREAGREFRDQVQLNVRRAAESTNREFAIMYDISGLKSSSDLERLVDHWQTAVDSGVTSSPSYLQDGGKPVVAIWGFGFSDRLSDANAALELLFSLKTSDKYSAQLFGGVPKNWRTDTDQWKAVYALYDIIFLILYSYYRFYSLTGRPLPDKSCSQFSFHTFDCQFCCREC